jgi:hypothetical protein
VILHSGPALHALRPETNALPRRIEGKAQAFALSGLSQPGSVIVVAHRAFRCPSSTSRLLFWVKRSRRRMRT